MDPQEAIRAVREVFARAPAFDERARGIIGLYRFDVTGVGSWSMQIDDGRIAVWPGGGAADCVIACDAEDALRIASGEQNLLTAAMQGRVRITGDVALAQRLHGFLPGPPADAHP